MNAKPVAPALGPPFRPEHQLNHEYDRLSAPQGSRPIILPCLPRLPPNATALREFLVEDLCPVKLNRLASHLWLCSTPYTNVPPLHSHAVHKRNIVLAEDPGLHLVWEAGRIFIKPLPPYLLSHAFWTTHLISGDVNGDKRVVVQSALGLLRSYGYCIRHESDLRVAKEAHLIPQDVTWEQWADFSASFPAIRDDEVAPRYHYGKIQLSRLHWLVRIYLGQLNYYYIDGGYGDSFARYYGPLLFIFGTLSVLLSAMQVGMAVEQLQSRDWTAFWSVCRWFSVWSLLLCATVALYLVTSFVIKSLDELLWAAKSQYRARSRPETEMT
ncbi:MAG: hypothetical protein L6R40_004621 [Gallowayella cf. fulva]|nr:MAG: hypothetical protein L6R40_004621 [Xanthomendoza cf. fulva]